MKVRKMTRLVVTVGATVAILAAVSPGSAWAGSYSKPGPGWTCSGAEQPEYVNGMVQIKCSVQWTPPADDSGGGHSGTNPGGSHTHVETPQEKYDKEVAEIQKRNEAEAKRYKAQMAKVDDLIQRGKCGGMAAGCPIVEPPTMIPVPDPPKGVKPPKIQPLPPIDAAYLAIAAKLQLSPSGVGIGPAPELSRWKMAVVGHSYWLWANGPTHLGPVSDSRAGYTVTLDARLAGTTFEMGDGGVVKCTGAGTPYPGDKLGLYNTSPTCGYAYSTTSRHQPGGTYPLRMLTRWDVAYSTPIGNGVIPILLASGRPLKVGELQTVITH